MEPKTRTKAATRWRRRRERRGRQANKLEASGLRERGRIMTRRTGDGKRQTPVAGCRLPVAGSRLAVRNARVKRIVTLRLKMPRSIVWLALFGFLSSTGLPLYESHGLGAADDAACVTTGEKSGHDVMSAPGADDAPKHCAVCHLLRAVNGSITPGIVALTAPA